MAEITMEMTPEQLATAMANRVTRERKRIAQRVEEFAAANPMGEAVRVGLYALAEEIKTGVNVGAVEAVIVEQPEAKPLAENDPGDGLPPVREMDDFAEGVALVQGGMHRRAVIGYEGAMGGLARD